MWSRMVKPSTLIPGRAVTFDAFCLDIARHRLWRGEQEIPLRPKSWDMLCYLVARPGLLVAKETLHREIWRDTAVSDDALTKVIAELRHTLRDDRRTPRLIETVHGLGFRFIAKIGHLESAPPGAAHTSGGSAASLALGRSEPPA